MELKELEDKVIEALVEARAARIIAEKALDKILTQTQPCSEPWRAPTEPLSEIPSAAPFIKMEEIEPRPSLASWYGKKAPSKRTEVEFDPITDDMGQDMWDESMEGSDE